MLTLARARTDEGVALGRLLAELDTVLDMTRAADALTQAEFDRLRACREAYRAATSLLDAVITLEDRTAPK